MSRGLEAAGEKLRAYREASPEQRRAMIEAHYAGLRAEACARYEARHGEGSLERRRAELAALPFPDRLSVAHPYPRDLAPFISSTRGFR